MRGLLLFVFVAFLGTIPLVDAQAPDAGSLTITSTVDEAVGSVEDAATFDVQVSFSSDNPLDTIQSRTILLSVSGAPEGWVAAPDRGHVTLQAGQSETITVTVVIGVGSEADDADLVVTAELLPRGVSELPVIGSQADPVDTADVGVRVLREDPLSRELVETVGSWLWLLLAAGIVLALVAAKLVFDTRRVAVKLHTDTKEVAVEAGNRVAVPLRVENPTRVEDTVVFHVAPMPDGWSAHLPVPELDLDGHQSENLHLIIQAPKDAPPGATEQVGISAYSAQAPKRAAELVITAVVQSEGTYART